MGSRLVKTSFQVLIGITARPTLSACEKIEFVKASKSYLHPQNLLMLLCLSVNGCHRDVPTIWHSELKSPDGAWVAIAHTEQDGGFGSAYIGTSVDLERTNGTVNRGKPFNVLNFDCLGPAPHAYVLDNANAGGTIDLHMRWLTPSNLEVTYNGKATVNLQVARFAGVNVSLRDWSQESSASTR
jgi:hypothetical protein